MSDEKPSKLVTASALVQEALTAGGGAGVAASMAAASGASPGLVVATAATALIPQGLAWLYNGAIGWKQREAAKWWMTMLTAERADDASAEEIAQEILDHQDKPHVRDTILRSVRGLLDALEPSVIPSLALLSREYIREKKKPDVFFRGTVGLLSNIASEDELADLKRIISELAAMPPSAVYGVVHVALSLEVKDEVMGRLGTDSLAGNPKLPYSAAVPGGAQLPALLPGQDVRLRGVANAHRLVQLLVAQELGRFYSAFNETEPVQASDRTHNQWFGRLAIDMPTLVRLDRIVRL